MKTLQKISMALSVASRLSASQNLQQINLNFRLHELCEVKVSVLIILYS